MHWSSQAFIVSDMHFGNSLLKSPGVDVRITFSCDFRPFSAQKLALFSKTNVMMKILHNLALLRVENAIFSADFFGENI
jgi:hypothetical protein